ncbi:hypothetical protein AUEXF2481DRAFT_75934 [Aureobasidium subglaciale EXF-2481]|uniref:Solute carrier family 40 protein n=1 Tax=Aureobasidium subglaciale (strain EXF-2481) TaxID=1043005 RepID=A0A074Z3P2_AURSE|nr:uncharacterized protein AUEXF2481DRAFT_75934 [Aureobasidium subglaciale EXF-2481]KAI5193563.1 hypothetical protein E4T38_09886 [Aureobasidium subglaciale]KAI5213101.1 hypothetical protein E4T40_09903 [Aureobasidium subglaciale]KAI5214456.1 hypothetical protein E4T41_09902 [Aureobasidium subglaciale]KAI5252497.1 hypothetical protein E4T46_09910 [Aureobasidium subglaciale]KER00933.1 hypothetical protein AUEXF2481DRAFT_75934 [Aureobasidium subglaciale EXF-2481]
MPSRQTCLLEGFLIVTLITTSQAMTRYVGDPTDYSTQNISQTCGGFNQENFDFGKCPLLMRCVLDELPSDAAAGFQSGGAIAGLVPTILALVAASPLELVQLAFLSPHRALATVCFGIGLPSGLFRQLRATNTSLTDAIPAAPKTRQWSFQLPSSAELKKRKPWRSAVVTFMVDILVLGLAAIALWFNYRVGSRVMITWRCEYGFLIFMWPCACVVWLLLSLLILWLLSDSIKVVLNNRDGLEDFGLIRLARLPYRNYEYYTELEISKKSILPSFNATPNTGSIPSPVATIATSPPAIPNHVVPLSAPITPPSSAGMTSTPAAPSGAPATAPTTVSSSQTHVTMSATPATPVAPVTPSTPANKITQTLHTITLSISMPDETGIRSWKWYEATIETLAVGVYLYATFVLTSTQFLSGNTGLTFVTIMALCSSIVRILENIFWTPR